MTRVEIEEFVCDLFYGELPDGSSPLEPEAAVQVLMDHTGCTRARAFGVLARQSPYERARRARVVRRVAGLLIAGAVDRAEAMRQVQDQTGMPLGWCAAALADAVFGRRPDGTWS